MVLSLRERLVELWNPEDPLDSLWRILASRYATALLLACLAILAAIVILVPQRPAEAFSDVTANRLWLKEPVLHMGEQLGPMAIGPVADVLESVS